MEYRLTERDVFMKLLDISVNTYYLWRRQERLVLSLLDKYFIKEDLEEFLVTGKVSKYEEVENSKFDNYVRTSEIIKFLTKHTAEHLASSLAICLESHGVISGTSKRLRKTTKKFDFLDDLDKILRDLISEDSKGESTPFKSIIDSFNKMIGFDFDKNDQPIVDHIIIRYRVYNTLHDLDV